MSMNADELNFLIRRHLEEAGYHHTAYVFGTEAMLEESNLDNIHLPPQALITILQKGMLYMQLEKGINEKARFDNEPESVISSLLEDVHHEDSGQIPRSVPRSRQNIPISKSNPVPDPINLPSNAALYLKGHRQDVYCGAWTHDGKYLATGSADATAIIWNISNGHLISQCELDHGTESGRKGKDIATLAWNQDGTLLASGCYDGTARLWTVDGKLKYILYQHSEPIFSVQFSPEGQYLLTGGSDNKVIVWSVSTGEIHQIFNEHSKRVLYVDWKDETCFASASGDGKIIICFVAPNTKPPIILNGHTEEVNQIAWDPSKQYLASCSDDNTVRVWRPFTNAPPIVLNGHTHNVYTVKWAPNQTQTRILASGGFDFTVRLWDIQSKKCVAVLQHKKAIYSVSFSPKGKYFVSGGMDQKLMIWRTSDQALIATYPTTGAIYETAWDPTGQNIAMFLADAYVAVLPTSNIPTCQE